MNYLDAGFNQFISREVLDSDPLFSDPFYSEVAGEKILPGISADNITAGKMSFDRAEGGILRLGGNNNISGQFVLNDKDGNEKITIDKDGMIIKNGSIIIKDELNQTIIDAIGLVSNTNFTSDFSDEIYNVTTTSTSYVDVPGAILAPFTLQRDAVGLLFLQARGQCPEALNNYNNQFFVSIWNGNVSNMEFIIRGDFIDSQTQDPAVTDQIRSSVSLVYLQQGLNQQFRVRYKVDGNGTGTASLSSASFGYVIFGK